jgi:hypothetical protein
MAMAFPPACLRKAKNNAPGGEISSLGEEISGDGLLF